MRKLEIRASLLARNTLLNFVGKGMPLLVGVVAIPFIVRGLGTERFGLLSLAWVILGYFTIFDFGLGRATTKYVAEALGKGEEDQVPPLVWTAVTVQGAFGLVGAIVLVGITPLLVEHLLSVPQALVGEAKAMFYWLAAAVPVVLVSSSFSGVLEAAQRFDLVNAVRIPLHTSIFLLPLLGLLLGLRLPGIVALILASGVVALTVLVVFALRNFPQLRRVSASFDLSPRLFAYGGWVTVSNVVGPFLTYLDRFLIASLVSMSAVAYYTAPSDAVTRLAIVPASLTLSLFPAFSGLQGGSDQLKLEALFGRSVKYVLLILGPIILFLVLFAQEILQFWLGGDFPEQSSTALQILALGVMLNSLAYLPYALLQGVGRPDITAKFHLLELPFYLTIAWFLINHWGITGAATAWTLRVSLDAILLFVAAFKVCGFSLRLFAINGIRLTIFVLLLVGTVSYGLKSLAGALPILAQTVLFVPLVSWFAWIVWRNVLDASDRGVIVRVVRMWDGSLNRT